MNNNTEGDFEVSQDTEANYVETVNVSLVEQQLNNSNSSSSAVEAAGQLRSNNGSFKVPSEREREGEKFCVFVFIGSSLALCMFGKGSRGYLTLPVSLWPFMNFVEGPRRHSFSHMKGLSEVR